MSSWNDRRFAQVDKVHSQKVHDSAADRCAQQSLDRTPIPMTTRDLAESQPAREVPVGGPWMDAAAGKKR